MGISKKIATDRFHVEGKTVYLRKVKVEDVNTDYVRWISDPDVNQYLETRFMPQTKKSVKEYVLSKTKARNELFLAICLKENCKHIGNIKLGPINQYHKYADISLVIGVKEYWGRGIAVESISLLAKFAFDKLKLHRLQAGCYKANEASVRAFEKAGFVKECIERSKWYFNGHYTDGIRLATFNADYISERPS
jgi:[ribosomal protein S5]-alanine N-acetyltransferase